MTNDSDSSAAPAAGAPRWRRTLTRIVGVALHPAPTFTSIAAEPDWLAPLLVLLLALVVSGHPIGVTLGVTLPLAALALLMLFRAAGGRGSFVQALAATVYSAYPRLVKALIVSAVSYSHLGRLSVFDAKNPLRANFGVLFDFNVHPRLFTLASSIDPFTLWSLALASIGFAAFSGLRRRSSSLIVFGVWGGVVLVTVVATGSHAPPP